MQDCHNSIASALELLQSCTKLSRYTSLRSWRCVCRWPKAVISWGICRHNDGQAMTSYVSLMDTSRPSPLSYHIHGYVIEWKHFPRYWLFVRWIHRSPVNSPHKGQWRGALMFSFICAWMDDWVNNREAGDLRRHRAHYDVTLMA